VKKFQLAVQAEDKDLAAEKLNVAIKLIDKSGSKGVYHRNTVSRKKSRLQTQFNALNKTE
jgi:small subunit ribosomal protein S20